jgi:hypothetical protein
VRPAIVDTSATHVASQESEQQNSSMAQMSETEVAHVLESGDPSLQTLCPQANVLRT